MPGAVGPHGQSQLNCFDHVKMGSGMGRAVGVGPGLAAGGEGGRHQENHRWCSVASTSGTLVAIGMGIRH